MPTRTLEFNDLNEAAAEAERLHASGYSTQGQWNLTRICDHLSNAIEQPVDGFSVPLPWYFRLVRPIVAPVVLKKVFKTRRMQDGAPAPARFLESSTPDEAQAVARLRRAVERLVTHKGKLHAHPFFGALTLEQNIELQTIHSAHHLRFLTPK